MIDRDAPTNDVEDVEQAQLRSVVPLENCSGGLTYD
jgi:hypothetical protein